jgi:hypothetical protein
MRSYYVPSSYVLLDDVTFSLGTVPVGKMTIPVAIFRHDNAIAACRIICPDSKPDAKGWLVARLRLAIDSQPAACHREPCCRECARSIENIHAYLCSWLSPEQHRELLEKIERA